MGVVVVPGNYLWHPRDLGKASARVEKKKQKTKKEGGGGSENIPFDKQRWRQLGSRGAKFTH